MVVSTWNVASVIEEINFKFNLTYLNLNSHMGQEASIGQDKSHG